MSEKQKIGVRVYKFRIYPTKHQERTLARHAGARRFVWNWALATKIDYYKKNGKTMSPKALSSELTKLKYETGTSWLQEMNAQSLQQGLRDLNFAFVSFFSGKSRFPRFKKKKNAGGSFRIPQGIKFGEDKIYVQRIGWLRIKQTRAIGGDAKGVTIRVDSRGYWYVSITSNMMIPPPACELPPQDRLVGIDVGLKDFAVYSHTLEKQENPKFYRKHESKIRRFSRVLSRRKVGSKRHRKARSALSAAYKKSSSRRLDFIHKLSTKIVRMFDGVCVEGLDYEALAKTKLGKSFLDAAHGEFRRQLRYKCLWYGKHFIAIGRFFPSTKRCHKCSYIATDLTLSDREWECCTCGTKHDRDTNAAINIHNEGYRLLAAGYAESINAQGADVRPGTARLLVKN